MRRSFTLATLGLGALLGLASCSLVAGANGEDTAGPVLPDMAVVEILASVEDIEARLDGWSLNQAPASVELESLIGASEVPVEVLEMYGEDCGGALFGEDAPRFEPAKEAANETFYDGEQGRLAVLSIYRMDSVTDAAGYVAYLRSAIEICRDASQRNPELGFSEEDTSFDAGALWFQERDGAEDEDRIVFVARGDLVVMASSRVSVQQADQLAQIQLDKLAALTAQPDAVGAPAEPAAQCTPETAENAGFPKEAFDTAETRSEAGLPIHWGGNPCWAIPAPGDDGQCAAWGYDDLVNAVTWNPVLQNDSYTSANYCVYYGYDGAMPRAFSEGNNLYSGTITVIIRLATPESENNPCYLQWGWAPELQCDSWASIVELGPVSGVDGAVIYSMTSTVEAQAPTLVADLYAVIQVPGSEAAAVVSLEYRPNTWASETQDQSDAVRMLEQLTAGVVERLDNMTSS